MARACTLGSIRDTNMSEDTDHPPVDARPGEDLYGVSVAELDARIAVYRAEITRLEAERVKKAAERHAAHAVFGSKS